MGSSALLLKLNDDRTRRLEVRLRMRDRIVAQDHVIRLELASRVTLPTVTRRSSTRRSNTDH